MLIFNILDLFHNFLLQTYIKLCGKPKGLLKKLLVCFIMESMITRMEVFLNKKGKAAEQKFAEMVIIHYCFIIFFI